MAALGFSQVYRTIFPHSYENLTCSSKYCKNRGIGSDKNLFLLYIGILSIIDEVSLCRSSPYALLYWYFVAVGRNFKIMHAGPTATCPSKWKPKQKKFFFQSRKKLETSIQTYCLSVYKCSWFSASQHILGVIFCRSQLDLEDPWCNYHSSHRGWSSALHLGRSNTRRKTVDQILCILSF